MLWTRDFRLLIDAAAADSGVTLLPEEAVAIAIRDDRLQRVLPSWPTEAIMIHLLYLTKRGLAPAVRAFIDALVDTFDARATLPVDAMPIAPWARGDNLLRTESGACQPPLRRRAPPVAANR